jgi:hypothetical protein
MFCGAQKPASVAKLKASRAYLVSFLDSWLCPVVHSASDFSKARKRSTEPQRVLRRFIDSYQIMSFATDGESRQRNHRAGVLDFSGNVA